jgi:superfamily I DNA/RNA helicase
MISSAKGSLPVTQPTIIQTKHSLKLFREHPHTVNDIRHVFIDEFQDTNTVQYQIMQCLGRASQAVTTVGDPDQVRPIHASK